MVHHSGDFFLIQTPVAHTLCKYPTSTPCSLSDFIQMMTQNAGSEHLNASNHRSRLRSRSRQTLAAGILLQMNPRSRLIRRRRLTRHATLIPSLLLLRQRRSSSESWHPWRRLARFGLVAAAAGDEPADEGVEDDHEEDEDGVGDGEVGLAYERISVSGCFWVQGESGRRYQQSEIRAIR